MNIKDVDDGVRCEFNFDKPEELFCLHIPTAVDFDVSDSDWSQPRWYCEWHRPDKQKTAEEIAEEVDRLLRKGY